MTTIVKTVENMLAKIMLLFDKIADRINQVDDRVKTLEKLTLELEQRDQALLKQIKDLRGYYCEDYNE